MTAHAFSETAREKIEAAGGTATALREKVENPPTRKRRKRRSMKPAAVEVEPQTEDADEAPAAESESRRGDRHRRTEESEG